MSSGAAIQRWLGIPLALLIAVALQSALLSHITFFGARPELVLLVAVAIAFYQGPEWGAVAGFVGGLLVDLTGVLPLGMTALAYTAVCYGVGRYGSRFDNDLQRIGFAGAVTIAAQLIVLILAFLIGQGTRGVTASQIVLTGIYNLALATLVIPAMHKLLSSRGGGY